jgi:hypothetical protein
MQSLPWRVAVALGAPAAALGTATAIGHVAPAFWVPVSLVGYALLIGGCYALAGHWRLAPGQAIVAGVVAAAWSVAGWVGGSFGVLVLAGGQCDNNNRVASAVAWFGSYGAGLVVYLAVSTWVLTQPRRLPAWVLAPLAGLLCLLPVATYAGICFD